MLIDLYVSGDSSVCDLEHDHIMLDTSICVHNDQYNPAHTIFLNLPETTDPLLDVYSSITAEGTAADLMILLKDDTYIHNGVFRDFKRVMITDHQPLEATDSYVILDPNSHKKTKLKIDNFRVHEGYLFATQVELINGGIAKTLLGIVLHGDMQNVALQGTSDHSKHFVVGELDIKSNINSLDLKHVLITKQFNHNIIKELSVYKCYSEAGWTLNNIEHLKALSLNSGAAKTEIFTDYALINHLKHSAGKFYISAKSYIQFRADTDDRLEGIDLILDMSGSECAGRKVNFPLKQFHFDLVKVINADDVSILEGGSCRELLFENCAKVKASKINAGEVKYSFINSFNSKGLLFFDGNVYNNLLITGHVHAIFDSLVVNNLEGMGYCKFEFYKAVNCKMLKLNLNVDAFNPPEIIKETSNHLALRINNDHSEEVIIDTILAKLSNFYVKGSGVKLGDILIQPINNIYTLFWVEASNIHGLKFNRLAVLSNCALCLSPDGTITLNQSTNQLTSGDLGASISSARGNNCAYVSVGGSIVFDGSLYIEHGDGGLRSKYGDVFVNGKMVAKGQLSLISERGLLHIKHAVLEAKAITFYSGTSSYISNAILEATEIAAFSLNGYINCQNVNFKAANIALVAEHNVSISNSNFKAQNLYLQSKQDTIISDSNIITRNLFTDSVRQFLLLNSNIEIKQHNYVLFGEQINSNFAQGGFRVAKDFQVVGVFGKGNNVLLTDIEWQRVDFTKHVVSNGSAYIDAEKGYIVGSSLDASDSIIIRTTKSLEVVPLLLHNEVIDAGGYNKDSVKEVVTRLNTGLIDIKAGESASFIGAILKAATGNIDADVLSIVDSIENIKIQQERVKTLGQFTSDPTLGTRTIGELCDFNKATNIAARINNLSVYDNYSSSELYFTQKEGDLYLDKSISKYDKLHVKAQHGKILITSPGLQNIYQGQGGGDAGKQAANDARTVIGGDNVYLIADEVISEAGKFNVSGELKIVAKDGVYLLPVSVHQSLMYHKGSKTTISEHEVRLVVSEINAGYLDIKAGGALTAVSALINATGVNLDVSELNLLSEREIFEKRIVFEGKEKLHGGSNESMDYFKDGLVIPTLINTDRLNAKVTGETTIEAAQILVKEESTIRTGGNVNMLAKYDIHIHDHESSKSYLFNFHKGKLTVAGTKTIKEHFYGENPVPTIYYNQGNFYGYSEGKVHLLGSKIIGDNIYLVADKGIKLEAAAFHQEKIVTISEQGIRTGFSSGGGTHSVNAEFFSQEEKTRFKNTFYDESELIARNNLVLKTPELIEVISSKMQFTKAVIKARGLHMHTHSNQMEFESMTTSISTGLHFGIQENISSTTKTIGHVLNKTGVHWLDIVDRALNGYEAIEGIKDICQDIDKLSALSGDPENNTDILQNLKSVKYGVWASMSVSTSHTQSHKTQAVDNQFIGGDIYFDIEEDAIIEGIKCDLGNFSLKAKNAFFSTSSNTSNQETYSSNINISVPISGSVGSIISSGFKTSDSESISYHDDNVVNIKGKLELKLAGDGVIRGVQFIANEVDIDAKNLLVETLQDVLKARMQGMNMSFGLNENTSSFGVKADMGKQDKAWSNAIGSIIGRNVVNVTVQQTLEIVGGLIANADINEDGSLTDKGKANVQAGKIIAKKLYDYDDGYSYGLGVSLNKTVDPDTGNIKYGKKVPVTYSFNENTRDILPTIGKGNLDVDNLIEGSINRDITKHTGETYTEKGSLDANLPISDIWDAIKPNSGIAAGDDYKDLVHEESSVDNAEYDEKVDSSQITEEVSREALHNSLIVLKASELGLPISQLVSDPKAYDMSLDVLNLDLTIAALNNYADTRDGAAAGAASRISKELVDIRKEVIKGGPSFSSVWKKTKDNLKSGKTTILNPTAVNLDAIGNMVSYVEDKVGYILASNMPKTTATLKAGFGYAMEKVIETGLEGAVEVFGQENVKSAKNSLERRLNWVDENYTKGQQKLLEYAGLYAATKVLSKVIAAIKHNKIPYLSEDLIPSLSKQEAHGVKILEKNGLNDELRNFSTAHEWKEFPDYVAHLDTKLPDVQGIKTSYPDGKGTLGIKKEWNRGHNEAVIKKAKPDSEHACQQVDYVSLKSNGQVLAKDGSFITKKPDGLYKANPQKNNPLAPDPNTEVKLPKIERVFKAEQHPDAHIPLSEWIKWKEWNKP